MRPVFLALLTTLQLSAAQYDTPSLAGMSDSEKLDSVFVMQKQVVRTIRNDPLADKRFGIEANIARMLYSGENTFSFSGGVSLFNINRHAELAFPFLYSASETDMERFDSATFDLDFKEFTQDVHYRYFLGNTQNGFFLSGFARYAHLSGIKGDVFDFFDTVKTVAARGTENKLGVGVGLGYRIFSYRGLYWGCSANLGRYIVGKNDQFREGFFSISNDSKYIFDIELLKFGWAF